MPGQPGSWLPLFIPPIQQTVLFMFDKIAPKILLLFGLLGLCSITGCGKDSNTVSGDMSEAEAFLEANPEMKGGSSADLVAE